MKKRKRARSSEGSSEPSKQSEEEEEQTDEDLPASRGRGWRNRSHRRSVATVSDVEEVGVDNDIVELRSVESVDTGNGSESGDVSSGPFYCISVM
jgi:hypothetical protein